jgi:uncharacterized protein DUF4381
MTPQITSPGSPGADPLAELRGIHLPAPIGFWPPAPGWWIAAGLLAAATLVAFVVVRQRRRSVGVRALRELAAIGRAPAAGDLQALGASLAELVRRVALVRFGARVASLHGASWEAFLREHAPEKRWLRRKTFAGDAGHVLALAPYVPPGAACLTAEGVSIDRDGLLAAARTWIRWNT